METLEAFRRAQGLPIPGPDEPYYTEDEAAIAFTPGVFEQLGMNDEQMHAVTRVLGRGLAQTAQVMRSAALEVTLEAGLSEKELAQRYARTVETIMPYVTPLIDRLLRMHLRNMLRSEALDPARPRGRPAHAASARWPSPSPTSSGFTRMGEEVPPDELGRVADRLAVIAGEIAESPVQFVKTIGDAVMLVSDDPSALSTPRLDLVDGRRRRGRRRSRRCASASRSGPAFARGGDWFGQPVNLASRVTTVARTGSVLATEEVREHDDAGHRWSLAGERRLKGLQRAGEAVSRRRPLDDPGS